MRNINNYSKVLILTKDKNSRGGVTNYYNVLFSKYNSSVLSIERFVIGSRSSDYYKREKRYIGYIIEYILDIIKYIKYLFKCREIKIVQVNPSLIPVPLFRDAFLILIAKLFKKKTIVFFRGWKRGVANKIHRNFVFKRIFKNIIGSSNIVIVLANEFRNDLEDIGVEKGKIIVTRTMYDGSCIMQNGIKHNQVPKFLFLNRISREKGAWLVIEAASILKNQGYKFRIDIHGHGAQRDTVTELKKLIIDSGIEDVVFVGDFLSGKEKYSAYSKSDIFLLPSYHEGCPNTILESMASGCFIICTGEGAMKEVVQDGINGKIVKTGDANDLADHMAWSIDNIGIVRQLGIKNKEYADNNYESKYIIKQMISIYSEVINE